jgi:predicted aspartyl protease
VAVAPTGTTQPSKWGTNLKAEPTKGHMMVDTGAAVTMVTKRWAELHGLRVSDEKRVTIRGAGGQNVEVIGTTAFTI